MNYPEVNQFKKINAIIERDSKDATYKFALLRGAIEISQEYDHLKQESGNRIEFPLGLLVEKWLLYYYPLIASPVFIPQKNGERENSGYGIAFRDSFSAVTQYYAERGGFSAFYNDYVNEHIPESISPDFRELVNNLKRTITTMPMKHLGRSVFQEDYSIFRYEGRQKRIPANTSLNQEMLVQNLGYFSFSKELYAVFQYFGSFISGEDSLLYKWAEFTKSASKGEISVEFALEKLRTYPITERDVQVAKRFYEELFRRQGNLECVWSGEAIKTMNSIHIDHLIPFSIWKNNDLWNLMPVNAKVNSRKSDRIPSPEFIEERRDSLVQYWNLLMNTHPNMFQRGISLSLTGSPGSRADLMDLAIERMKEKCEYLIEVRGYEAWRP